MSDRPLPTGRTSRSAASDAGKEEMLQVSFPLSATIHTITKFLAARENQSLTALFQTWITERARREAVVAQSDIISEAARLSAIAEAIDDFRRSQTPSVQQSEPTRGK